MKLAEEKKKEFEKSVKMRRSKVFIILFYTVYQSNYMEPIVGNKKKTIEEIVEERNLQRMELSMQQMC